MKTLTNDLINNSENIITFEKKLTWIQKGQWIVKEKIEKIKLWIIEKIFTNLIETKKWKKKKQLENANLIYDEKIKEIKEKINNLKQDSFQQVKNSLVESNSEFSNLTKKEEVLINFNNETENLLNLIKKTTSKISTNSNYQYIDIITNHFLTTLSNIETEETKKYITKLNEKLKKFQEYTENLIIDFKEIKLPNLSSSSLVLQLDNNIEENIKKLEEYINKILEEIEYNLYKVQDKINIKTENKIEDELQSLYLTKFIESSWENIEEITHIVNLKWWIAWKLKIWWKYYPFMSIKWEDIEIAKYDDEWNQINWYNPLWKTAKDFNIINWWIAGELKIWNNNDEYENETYAFKWIKWKKIEILKSDQNWDKINSPAIYSYPWWLKLSITKKIFWDDNEYKWTVYHDAIWENWKKLNVFYKDKEWYSIEQIKSCHKLKWWIMWICQSLWKYYPFSLSWEEIKVIDKDKKWNSIQDTKEVKQINNWITWKLKIKWKEYSFKWIIWEEIQIWKNIN